jgi:hypothetical protein
MQITNFPSIQHNAQRVISYVIIKYTVMDRAMRINTKTISLNSFIRANNKNTINMFLFDLVKHNYTIL